MKILTGIWRFVSRFIPATKYDAYKSQVKIMTLKDAVDGLKAAVDNNTNVTKEAIALLGKPPTGGGEDNSELIQSISDQTDILAKNNIDLATANAAANEVVPPPAGALPPL